MSRGVIGSDAPDESAARYPKLDYDAWARTVPVDDLWRQVRRTVGGRPVSERDIGMIVQAIVSRLDLRPTDALIDLACGNGALSSLLFPHCGEFLGSDISEYLIAVAESRFAAPPRRRFLVLGAAEHARGEPDPGRFTKALCYGSFAYLSAGDAAVMLRALHDRFRAVERVFIGNLPDRNRAGAFYADRTPSRRELADPGSQIGIWRTREEFASLARATGWRAEITTMPPEFFASRYRYDALLMRDEA